MQIDNIVLGIFKDLELLTFIFLILDLLIYFDRGILPGLHEEVKQDLLPLSPEFYFGVLQSTFIGGLAVAAPLLAYLSIKIRNLLIFVSFGLGVWNLSLFACCISGSFKWLIPLFISRAVSGVGEAAFSSLVVPAMVDCQPPHRRGIFLGIFYALMPLGVSLGYIISSALPVLCNLSYAAAFGFLGSAALPYTLVIIAISALPEAKGLSPWSNLQTGILNGDHDECRAETAERTPKQRREDLEQGNQTTIDLASQMSRRHIRSPQIMDCPTMITTTTSPVIAAGSDYNIPFFISLTIAGAALAAVNATFAAFSSAMLLDLGLFETEVRASSTVGIVAIGVGAVGTFSGGLLSQAYMNEIDEDDRRETGKISAYLISVAGLCGSTVALAAPLFLLYHNKFMSLICLSIGLFFLCICQAPLNLGIMSSCKKTNRSMALSIYTLSIHFVGDVPGPIVIGWLKDVAESVCDDLSSELCVELRRLRLLQVITFLLLWTIPIWLGGAIAWQSSKSSRRMGI